MVGVKKFSCVNFQRKRNLEDGKGAWRIILKRYLKEFSFEDWEVGKTGWLYQAYPVAVYFGRYFEASVSVARVTSLSLYLYHLLAPGLPVTHFEVAPYVMYVAAVTKTDQTACNVWQPINKSLIHMDIYVVQQETGLSIRQHHHPSCDGKVTFAYDI